MGKRNKEHRSEKSKVIFLILSVGFTAISALNGFNFYNILLGSSLAILISIVFEIGRLASLYRLFHLRGKNRVFGYFVYITVALVCSFASVNSFTTDFIIKNRKGERFYDRQINILKSVYSDRIQKKIGKLDIDIKYLENRVAKYQKSGYLKRRLLQIENNRDELITKRDDYLNTIPKDPEKWIKVNSGLLGLKLKDTNNKSEKIISQSIALRELWGIDNLTMKKIIGFILTIFIEMSIFLLASLGVKKRDEISDRDRSYQIHSRFDENLFRRFISLNREYFNKNGKLLPLNRLNTNLRPIRNYVRSLNDWQVKQLFEK